MKLLTASRGELNPKKIKFSAQIPPGKPGALCLTAIDEMYFVDSFKTTPLKLFARGEHEQIPNASPEDPLR